MQMKIDELLGTAVNGGAVRGVTALLCNRKGIIYQGGAGAANGHDMHPDTVCTIYSMTKPITAAAAMQLVEQGRLSLDAPAGDVCPYLHEVQVFEGYASDGSPILREPASPVTLRQLLTHTSGFVYEMWNEKFKQYMAQSSTPPLQTLQRAALQVPLMFDPGTHWEYGIGIDWAGLMVEAVSGKSLGEYLTEHLTGPLGMHDTAFTPTPSMIARMAVMGQRESDGRISLPEAPPQQDDLPEPEFEMGGGGLLSTARDYARFMRMILNRGELDGARVLAPETVEQMASNQMGDLRVGLLKSVEPMLTNDAEFFPGSPKSWGLSFQINQQAEATGRAAGTLMWAGLSNCYFWIDRSNDIAGLMLTQLLPFADEQCLDLFYALETAAYDAL
jgi:methyl acetate hydrolase